VERPDHDIPSKSIGVALDGWGSYASNSPWPSPASLSGHAKGHWRTKSVPTKRFREWARLATLAENVAVPETGDIRISVTFYPPDRRGDRTNYPNRIKPLLDGIADALKVNDRRFLPSYHFAEPSHKPCVVITIGGGL
jgi:hypothetical protein